MKISFDYRLPKQWFSLLDEYEWVEPNQDAEVLMASVYLQVNRPLLEKMPSLRLVVNYGVGYDNIDLDACAEKHILVANTPQPVIEPTAELCMTLMLALSRRIGFLCNGLKNGSVQFSLMDNLGHSLYGKTLGIIGMGNIGRAVARRAVACGMNILYHNRHPLEDAGYAEYVSMEQLLLNSDFVSLNLPYSSAVHHLIGAEELAKMKNTAFLINTARGPLVDEKALIDALQNGTIAGAALDVFEHEPKISPELLALDNCLVVPHIGTATLECRQAMAQAMEDNVRAYLNGNLSKMTLVQHSKR